MKELLRRHLLNSRGWRTREKLLVIQSDDWGSIRTGDLRALDALETLGVASRRCHYMCYDTIASDEDLQMLFDVLRSVRDANGRPAVLTANVLVGNPDFDRIRASGFQSYHSIGLNETFERLRGTDRRYALGLGLWKQGLGEGLFIPQLHGHEHLNVARWMAALQKGHAVVRKAFEWNIWGVSRHTADSIPLSLQAALDVDLSEDGTADSRSAVLERLQKGVDRFGELFGYDSRSFIAPNYTWFPQVEKLLHSRGVQYMQSGSVQREPVLDDPSTGVRIRNRRRFNGERSPAGMTYLVRNVHLEPSAFQMRSRDAVADALRGIEAAFRWGRPAILSTHRVNYVGVHDPNNRARGLSALREVLSRVCNRWPDVQFLSTEELGERMTASVPATNGSRP